MSTTTQVSDLKINKMTSAQFATITPSETELYFITDDNGITSTDVTNALGYTPYNATNPNGYQANVIETIKVNGTAQTVTTKTVNITVPAAPTVNDANMVIQRNGTAVGTFTANQSSASTINISVPTTASDVGALPDSTTIGSGNLVIQRNGTAAGTFNANATSNSTINISVPTNTTELTNGSGYITSISSSDVTTALGYTPYNNSNPSGYQANIIETVKVNGTALTPSTKTVDITIPAQQTVGDANMVIQRNGTAVGTFTANQTSASTISISVPTQASDIGALPDTTTIGDANLVIQRNSTAVGTFTANATSAKTISISVPTQASDIGALPDSTFIPSVDQTYLATSTNAQSGTAVAGAISGLIKKTDLSIASGSTNYLEYNSSTGAFGAKVDGTVTASSTNLVTSGAVDTAINNAIVGGVTYKGAWTITTSTTTFSGIILPVKKGYMYYVTGTGPATVDSIEWNPGDYLLVNADVASGGSLSGKVEKIDNTESTDIVKTSATQTLTNKTIDADDNTIKDLTTSNLKSGVLQTTVRATSTASDTSLASEKAIAVALEGKQPTGNYTTYNGSSAVGSATQPVYIDSSGVATATTYSLAKSVPSDAVFTDTTYTFSTGLTESSGTVTVNDYNKLLKNTATGTNGLTINGVASNQANNINIGKNSSISGSANTTGCVVIGNSAVVSATGATVHSCVVIGQEASVEPDSSGMAYGAIALGSGAHANNYLAIQIGTGTNSTNRSFNVGFGVDRNYQLLNGATGLIPDERLSTAIARATDIANMATTNTAQTISETKTFTTQQKFQDGNGTGCMIIGADVSASTVTEGTRKLGRIVFHTKESNTINCAAFTTDTEYTPEGSSVTSDLNCVELGGRIYDPINTSPDRIGFTVAKVKNSVSAADKLLVCDMDKEGAHFYAQPDYNGDNLVTQSTIDNGIFSTGTVLSDTAGCNRIKYYLTQSFDESKFTKAGTPTITDGVAGGFSATDYLTLTTNIISTTSLKFSLKFTTPASLSTNQPVTSLRNSDNTNYIDIWIQNGALRLRAYTGTNVNKSFTIAANTTYYAQVEYASGTWYGRVSTDGSTWTEQTLGTAPILSEIVNTSIGRYSGTTYEGSVDLKTFEIVADGSIAFTGKQSGTATYNINNVTVLIPYIVTPIGRVVDSAYRTSVNSVYSTYGYAPYYTIDTSNNNYTLPQGEIYGVTTMMAKQAVEDSK